MNINASSATTTINSPQIINYPRVLIDRKPDDEQMLSQTRYVINSNQSTASTTSATVPQTVSIPLLSISSTGVTSANGVIAAKKCAFHRQCLHIHQSSSAAPAQQHQHQQQVGHHHHHQSIHLHPHQIQLPLQTTAAVPPPQHQQPIQQIRINNLQASPASTSVAINVSSPMTSPAAAAAAITLVNRISNNAAGQQQQQQQQPKRDAISTSNIAPQLNAALLQDRYLLLDMVDGSSFYKCIDITTQKMLVCKVGGSFFLLFLFVCCYSLRSAAPTTVHPSNELNRR